MVTHGDKDNTPCQPTYPLYLTQSIDLHVYWSVILINATNKVSTFLTCPVYYMSNIDTHLGTDYQKISTTNCFFQLLQNYKKK